MFSIFDKDQDGAISIEEIGAVLRSIGFNPTEREIHDIQNSFHQQCKSIIYINYYDAMILGCMV